MDDEFIELISLTDRVRRRCLEFIRNELDQLAVNSINPTQALMLVKIGHLAMSPTELIERGDYPGTNPSYNVNRLVECGLAVRERRARDHRSVAVRLTDKGHHLRRQLLAVHRRESGQLAAPSLAFADVVGAADALRRLERSLSGVPVDDSAPRRRRRSPRRRAAVGDEGNG